ncbi:MAG TPA: thioesterase domain-containing protein, partial [Candidatus Eisenbacteria bacterium]|nr:thioesterase domain-containing protein [Candidatus Eisenbacteria bacterium]
FLLTGGDVLHRRPPAGLPFVLVNNYGPTESTVVATSGAVPPAAGPAQPGPAAVRPPSIGRPILGCRIAIVDDRLRAVVAGSPGELLLGGEGVARGYLSRPELTRARFIPDPSGGDAGARLYRTGDLVRELAGGELEFLGRLDDQVQIRGYRIEPAEIVAALDTHPGVRSSGMTAPAGLNGEQRLVAYVVPRDGASVEREELRRHLGSLLPAHMVPSAYVYLAELPLTPNGKLDRAALPAPDGAAVGVDTTSAPRTELERELGATVAELLGLERVGLDQDFFTLGGHSLMAAQLVARIQARYGVDVALISVFQARTVSGLAAAVEGAILDTATPGVAASAALDVLAQPSGTRPALFFVVSDESGLSALHHFIGALGEDQPVVGLVPPRRNRRFDRDLNVTHLAERHVAVIRERQPHGPYCLCGHSLGGLLAYEAAGQLRSQGEEVAWVGLLDTMVPAASQAVLERERRLAERLRRLWSRAAAVGLRGALEEVGTRRAERMRASLGLPLSPDQFDFPGADTLTITYRAVGHDAPLEVFATDPGRRKAGSSALGWETLHRGPLQWHPVAGDHHTVLHEPDAEAVGLFAGRLLEAQRPWAEQPAQAGRFRR